jgi:acylphosphatase
VEDDMVPGAPDPFAGSPSGEVVRLEATVRGIVQGVGYRWFVLREAARLELSGWVSNHPDGSVRVVAEGRPGDLAALLERLEEGPAGALVDRVLPAWMPAVGLGPGFAIRSFGHRGD